jgi:hypothetical protein
MEFLMEIYGVFMENLWCFYGNLWSFYGGVPHSALVYL